ncbi:lytic murein transglycosylase [Roseomonas marmotae]|uniref:Lytic murein transglycosylase n=1 Tax=Roseomonas marmotae TaxID=2768161 RepID=A0ABS3KCY0_9PROT|nr:lytic murein transglycosylase [Roseomonas marmotae]MBO1075297.1 lytic murein transglycosylase [Roseomonas marmotae]QTI78278.1 lytic murein transglycosylase [Roseomonas marmotae]
MLNRRSLIARFGVVPLLLVGGAAEAQAASFQEFLGGVAAEARGKGVSQATLQRALGSIRPNDKVLELDRRQPEFTLTWDQYRDGRVSAQRVERGRKAFMDNQGLLEAIGARYQVSPRVIVAVWGLETNYGGFTGNFNVVEALATLAWEGRRASFFRAELMAALRILEKGDVTPERMRGSYAGAMGHPQFMPTSFERLAVDFNGDGRRDIWDDRADALASIANYLARSGWRSDERWGREVRLPGSFNPSIAGRTNRRPLRDWVRMGVTASDGSPLPPLDMDTAILLPGGAGGQAFAVYQNFNVIRRYNPSDYYALVIGLLSDLVA